MDDDKIEVEASGLRWSLDLVQAAPEGGGGRSPRSIFRGRGRSRSGTSSPRTKARSGARFADAGKIVFRYGPGFRSVMTGSYKGNRVDFQGRDADGVSGSGLHDRRGRWEES